MGELLCVWLSATQPSTLHHQGSPTPLLISGGAVLCGEGPRSQSRHRPSQPVALPPNHPSLSVHTREMGLTLPALLSEETVCAEAPRKLPVTLRVTPAPASQPHPFQPPHPSSQLPGPVHKSEFENRNKGSWEHSLKGKMVSDLPPPIVEATIPQSLPSPRSWTHAVVTTPPDKEACPPLKEPGPS